VPAGNCGKTVSGVSGTSHIQIPCVQGSTWHVARSPSAERKAQTNGGSDIKAPLSTAELVQQKRLSRTVHAHDGQNSWTVTLGKRATATVQTDRFIERLKETESVSTQHPLPLLFTFFFPRE